MSKKGSLNYQEDFKCNKCLGKGINPYTQKKCGYCKGTGTKKK